MNPFAVLGIEETADDGAVRDEERRLALRLFGPAPLDSLEALLDAVPDERRHVGPGPWLDLLRGDRP